MGDTSITIPSNLGISIDGIEYDTDTCNAHAHFITSVYREKSISMIALWCRIT